MVLLALLSDFLVINECVDLPKKVNYVNIKTSVILDRRFYNR